MKNINYQVLRFGLDKLKEQLEEVAGEWDGDNAGALEERAMAAKEAEEKVRELEDLLEEVYPGAYEKSN